ncbi:MAG: cyclase family protein [Saprospiraceae bacterium]|nr:cyclase family protein [Lewinella sp.]
MIPDLTAYNVIDLTLTYDEGIAGYAAKEARKLETDGWNAKTLSIYAHAGTHMDAPLHFGMEGTIDAFTPVQLMGPAWIAQLEPIEPAALIRPEDLGEIRERAVAGDSLLLRTGWSRFVSDPDLFRNRLPRVSPELAQWCVDTGIRMLGVEPPSVADVNNQDEVTRIHRLLFAGKVIIVEGLTNLAAIVQPKVLLIALPLKISGGDGAPARVIALESKIPVSG